MHFRQYDIKVWSNCKLLTMIIISCNFHALVMYCLGPFHNQFPTDWFPFSVIQDNTTLESLSQIFYSPLSTFLPFHVLLPYPFISLLLLLISIWVAVFFSTVSCRWSCDRIGPWWHASFCGKLLTCRTSVMSVNGKFSFPSCDLHLLSLFLRQVHAVAARPHRCHQSFCGTSPQSLDVH